MEANRIQATYFIETAFSLEHAAEVMAGEQSTGTFVSVPGETSELREQHGARVERITELGESLSPMLPGASVPKGSGTAPTYRRGEVTVSFPLHNPGASLPNLLSTVAGNLYELRELSAIRLLDLELPEAFAAKYPGPQFGVAGTRKLCGVYDRPIIGTIIKPSIGLPAAAYGPLVQTLAEAGLDFIKDDELCANPDCAPLVQRVPIVMKAIERAADRTGKKLMYAFNITGDIDELRRNHDLVAAHGGTCVMVSVNSVGLAGTAYLRQHATLPIHGHRNQWGAMSRYPGLGMGFAAYQKLCRLAGTDHIHTNGWDNKFSETNEEVVKAIMACRIPFMGGYEIMPVLSSAQWAGTAAPTYEAVGTVDLLQVAGGGILAHPGGAAAGVASMKQAWEAAVSGIPAAQHALAHPELGQALEKFSQ